MNILLAYAGDLIHGTGGSEKVLCEFANEMLKRGHSVSIGYCYGEKGDPFYHLDTGVPLFSFLLMSEKQQFDSPVLGRCLSKKQKIIREILRIYNNKSAYEWNDRCKRKLIHSGIEKILNQVHPDIIISFSSDMTYYLQHHDNIPIITMFHMEPTRIFNVIPQCEINAISKSGIIQVLMPSFADSVKKHIPNVNLMVIPNIVPQYEFCADLCAHKSIHRIINVGRLNKEQKQQHLLVHAFSRIYRDFPDWQLELWGDSKTYPSYVQNIKDLIQRFSLEDKVFIQGTTRDTQRILYESDIFCFPSAYEGFPLAMTEAMSAGLPVIAFKSCPAVNELIKDEVSGLLVEDNINSLALGLKDLMSDLQKRALLGKNAHEAIKKYASEKIWDQWERSMKYVIENH